ncbi:MAG TPA: hypothetical protein ENK35_03715 [Candidatus Tenderia sp.]|nr:hypothetical protein [Candidatus Tenderia sp.]
MLKPAKNEMLHALQAAEHLREHNLDKHHIAKALLYFAERNRMLEKVLSSAELYLHFGQGSAEHASLVRAIKSARNAEKHSRAALSAHD